MPEISLSPEFDALASQVAKEAEQSQDNQRFARNVVDEKIKIGDKGIAITRLAPVGMAEFNGERIEVYSSTTFIDANTSLEIEAIEGNRVRVKVINN